ncbi:unnamed protein product [Pipistrellus nathusii]|uniref:Protein-tyrosine-phosphatase n=1 Tax=Pipistrellus nathusii TaxID=59473 RepID=A0ABP0AK06_PIPNA
MTTPPPPPPLPPSSPPPPLPRCPLPIEALSQPLRAHGLSQLTTSLYIGNAMAANNRQLLSTNQITTVVNISAQTNTFIEGIQYLKVPVADSPRARIGNFFDAIADYIHNVELRQGRTLVHCRAGISRSATVCIAFLMKYHSMSLIEAYTWIKACRPIIRPNIGFWDQLIRYEFKLFTKNTVQIIDTPLGKIPDAYQKEFQMMMST